MQGWPLLVMGTEAVDVQPRPAVALWNPWCPGKQVTTGFFTLAGRALRLLSLSPAAQYAQSLAGPALGSGF